MVKIKNMIMTKSILSAFTARALLLVLAAALFLFSCKKDDNGDDTPANTPPVASFTVDPQTGNTQTPFSLDASGSSDQETPAAELLVRWDGNDDGVWETDFSTVKTATVTYDTEGTYTIRLEVKDGGGLTASTTRQVTVSASGGNQPPGIPADPVPADGATEVPTGALLQWSCSDPEQDPLTYDVYFGTGTNPPLVSQGQTATSYQPPSGANLTTYYWKVTAHDDQGNSTAGPLWQFTTQAQVFSCGEDFTDPRDGKVYGSVLIGSQCWMSENLNAGLRIDGANDMTDNGIIEKYCYNNDDANCEQYGGLYQWDEMMQYTKKDVTGGICPEGWHLPTLQEWEALEMALGMPEEQATASSGWQGTDEGDMLKEGGSTGFNALMGGNRSTSGAFTLGGLGTAFWAATQSSTYFARARTLDTDHSQINHTNYDKRYGHSVRCIKD